MENRDILKTLEYLLKLAATGENFAADEYNKERYKTIREQTEKLYKDIYLIKPQELLPVWEKGYLTPKVGVNAIIKNDKGQLLLELRKDDHCWGIPGGWAEVGLSAEENILKEIKEETGLEAKVMHTLNIFCRKPTEKWLHTSYHILFECGIVSGTIQKSFESEDIRWMYVKDVDRWHYDHKTWIESIGMQ